jgi:hypothetical protein
MATEPEIERRQVLSEPNGWVRLEQVRKIPGHLQLSFTIHEENRGRKRTDGWNIICKDVREAQITDLDGGGLALYSTFHPAARQYTARQAQLHWTANHSKAAVLGALYQAHTDAVDDWIPFDRYLSIKVISSKKCVCRGPHFLLRAYARALRANGENPHLRLLGVGKTTRAMLRVLHFGESFVVARGFRISSEVTPRKIGFRNAGRLISSS